MIILLRAGECKNVSKIYECTYANTLLEVMDPWGKVIFVLLLDPQCLSTLARSNISSPILIPIPAKGALHDRRVLQLQPVHGVEHQPGC